VGGKGELKMAGEGGRGEMEKIGQSSVTGRMMFNILFILTIISI